MSRSYQIGLRRIGAIAGIAGGGGGVLPVPKFTTCAGGICPETAGIAEIPGEFAYMKLPRGAICIARGGAASNGGVLPGPGTPFAYSRGGICPETAGIAEIPGEFAYMKLPRGAICTARGGAASNGGGICIARGGAASNGGVLPGPGTPFAYSRGGICPETAGIAEIPGEFAYTKLPRGAICNDVGGVVSYQGCLINSTGGG